MATFLSIQVPTEGQIRLKPSSELHLTLKAQQVSQRLDHTLRASHVPSALPRWKEGGSLVCSHMYAFMCWSVLCSWETARSDSKGTCLPLPMEKCPRQVRLGKNLVPVNIIKLCPSLPWAWCWLRAMEVNRALTQNQGNG